MPGPGHTLSHDLRQTATPTRQMLLLLDLIQKPALELQARVAEELEQNPALEEVPVVETEAAEKAAEGEGETFADDPAEPPSDVKYDPATEKTSGTPVDDLQAKIERLAQLDQGWREHFSDANTPVRSSEDDREKREFMIESLTASTSLQAELVEQVRTCGLDQDRQRIAETIIGNIDDRGYLRATLEEMAFAGNFPLDHVQDVLAVVQGFEPAGVGARDLRECLVVQLARLGRKDSLEYRILKKEMEALGRHRFPDMAQRLGCTISEVQAAAALIAELNPCPGLAMSSEDRSFVVPDVVVQRANGEYAVALRRENHTRIRINRYYLRLVNDPQHPEARDYIREKIHAGKLFMRCLGEGQSTILKIAREVVKRQQGFMDQGAAGLKPLMMAEVAREVGVDESVVSRAVSGKYMETPQGVIAMRRFFTSGLETASGDELSNECVKEQVAEMFRGEDRKSPLSDEDVVRALNSKGIKIARRTVTKYREELKILSSSLRRTY